MPAAPRHPSLALPPLRGSQVRQRRDVAGADARPPAGAQVRRRAWRSSPPPPSGSDPGAPPRSVRHPWRTSRTLAPAPQPQDTRGAPRAPAGRPRRLLRQERSRPGRPPAARCAPSRAARAREPRPPATWNCAALSPPPAGPSPHAPSDTPTPRPPPAPSLAPLWEWPEL